MNLVRVINSQALSRSILLDKIDKSQGNSPGYAAKAKQKLYVPLKNPLDLAVAGYVDLIMTDEVLLASSGKGTIAGLSKAGYVSNLVVDSSLLQTPVISGAVHSGGSTTITGTTLLSVPPDVTYVTLTNTLGVSEKLPQGTFTTIGATTIVIADGVVAIGTPGTGWKVTVQANSKVSNQFTM